MAHFQRLNPDTFYVNGVAIPSSYFQGLDTAQAASVNGDAGGTYDPTGPMVISGAGIWLAAPWASVTGVSVNTGIATTGTKVDFEDNDAPLLSSGHVMASRTIIQSPGAEWGDASAGSGSNNPVSGYGGPFWSSPGFANGDLVGGGQGTRAIIPLDVHHLGTLSQVMLTMLPSPQHVALPQVFPQMRVYAVDAFGNVIVLGAIGGAGYQSIPVPTSVAAYAGVTQAIVYTILPDAVVDRSGFTYLLEIVDEAGTGSIGGNRFQQISTLMTSIPAIYFE